MAGVEIVVPRLGLTMESGKIVEWLKLDGTAITVGEPLFIVETDKAQNVVEAEADGILHILPDKINKELPVGTIIGYIEPIAERQPGTAAEMPPAMQPENIPAVVPEQVLPKGRVQIAPQPQQAPSRPGMPKLLMPEQVLSPNQKISSIVTPEKILSSPPGRLAMGTPASPVTTEELKAAEVVRKNIIRPTTKSAHLAASVTITTEADATELVRLRQFLEAEVKGRGRPVPSFIDLLVKLVSHALEEHPALNASWTDEGIIQHPDVHIGLAVDTPQGVLVVVIHNTLNKTLMELATETESLAAQARSGKIDPARLHGSTFTIISLGAFDIDAFTPIINPPQCAILGVGSIRPKAVVTDKGQIAARDMVTLSLTFDHRAVDGAPAARFLQRIKKLVEQPLGVLF